MTRLISSNYRQDKKAFKISNSIGAIDGAPWDTLYRDKYDVILS